jgi:uncharacterized protein (DUF302 family)
MKQLILLFLFTSSLLLAKGDIHLYSLSNVDFKVNPNKIESTLQKSGFVIAKNTEMTGPFKKQFAKTKYQIFSLLTIYHPKHSIDLLKKSAISGLFTPFTIGIYQEKDDKSLHLAFLTAKAQADILNYQRTNPLQTKIEKEIIAALSSAYPNMKHSYSKSVLEKEGNLITSYTKTLEKDDDWEEIKEEVELLIEENLKPAGFIMANYTDINYDLTEEEEEVESDYHYYGAYSICKLEVIYTVALTNPEASAFAPCTMIVYQNKKENKVVIAYPSVYNWIRSSKITSEPAKKALYKAQKAFETLLKEASE